MMEYVCVREKETERKREMSTIHGVWSYHDSVLYALDLPRPGCFGINPSVFQVGQVRSPTTAAEWHLDSPE